MHSGRQGELENCAPALVRHGQNPASVPFDDLLADRQPNAVAGIFGAGVEAVENDEHVLGMLRGDADAVVGHREQPFVPLLLS